MNFQEPSRSSQGTLESWKEIAAYLQRDAKTAQRWEKEEGLPVHRHSHKSRSSVYAYTGEIEAWRASRKAAVEVVQAARPLWRFPAFAVTILMCLIMVGNGIRPAEAQQSRPIAKRLVISADAVDKDADFSPDGRSMVFTDWNDSQDLAIRDMSTGKVKRLLAKPLLPKDSDAYAQVPAFSPDRRQIAYFWDPGGKDSQGQLRVMANEVGGKSRSLIDKPEYNALPAAWFPDGKSILVTLRTQSDRTDQLARVSVSDGAIKGLKPLQWRFTDGRPNLSPDGRFIAYSALAVNPSKPLTGMELARNPDLGGDRHIYVLAADGSGEAEIVKTSGVNRNPVWTPDGKHILFTSDRSGKVDLWSIAMQNGKAAGAPSLVRAEIGDVHALGIYGGSYYYEHRQPAAEYVHIAEAVPGADAPRESEAFVGMAPTWSPDGKSIAFKRLHPGTADAYDLVVHSIETGEERTYLTSLGTTGGGAPNWFHDSKSVMTGIKRGDGSVAFYRIDLKTGDFKELPTTGGQLSPDDKTAYIVRRGPDNQTPDRLLSVDMSTGQERQILVSPAVGMTQGLGIALSPDGRTLALLWLDRISEGATLHIGRVSVDGSDFREVFTRPDHLFGGGVAWSKDGRSILFRQEQPDGAGHWGVMRVPAEGGASASLVFTAGVMRSFDLSPDGSRFVYNAREFADELWALDNVLSGLK